MTKDTRLKQELKEAFLFKQRFYRTLVGRAHSKLSELVGTQRLLKTVNWFLGLKISETLPDKKGSYDSWVYILKLLIALVK